MTLADAKWVLETGVAFGDVYPRLETDVEREALKEFFVSTPTLPNRRTPPKTRGVSGVRNGRPAFVSGILPADSKAVVAKAAGYTGDECPVCQGLRMTRNGSCLKCEDCGSTNGCS